MGLQVELLAACGGLAVTLGLVVTRPRVGPKLRLGPAPAAAAGVLVMLAFGVVSLRDVEGAGGVLVRPLLTIVALMVTTAVAQRIGLLDRLAERVFANTTGSGARLFFSVFLLSGLTAATLNNDAAVLLLTPAVVGLVRRRYPGRPGLVTAFAFAVFMAAGVAPLVLSNPMNLVFAAYAGIDFNAYAARMIPIWLAGGVVAAWTLWLVFRRVLATAPMIDRPSRAPALEPVHVRMLVLMFSVLAVCPLVAYVNGPVWAVAMAGAGLALLFVARPAQAPIVATLRQGIAWDILAFLVLVSVLGLGLRNAGLVGRLSSLYAGGDVAVVGLTSAIGSAVINNHPMSIANMLALHDAGSSRLALAALVGGDLGPRLLPMGSLAGLLWLEKLREAKVEIPLGRFVLIGLALTLPTLVLSLFMVRWL
jgi:arsenical pump membrane protein